MPAEPVPAEPAPADPPPDGPPPDDPARDEGLTAVIAAVVVPVALAALLWGGWRWWENSAPPPAAVGPTRLGVLFAPVPVPPDEDPSARPDPPGLLVIALDADGAARRAGAREGDVWLTFAGRPLCAGLDPRAAADRAAILRSLLGPGYAVEVELLRGGERVTLSVRDDLPPRPDPPPPASHWPTDLPEGRGYMGVELLTAPPDLPGVPPGVIVAGVLPGSPAERADVRVGDRLVGLTRAGGPPDWLARARDWFAAAPGAGGDPFGEVREIRPGDAVTVHLLRHGRPRTAEATFVAADDLPRPRVRPPPPIGL